MLGTLQNGFIVCEQYRFCHELGTSLVWLVGCGVCSVGGQFGHLHQLVSDLVLSGFRMLYCPAITRDIVPSI